MLRTGGQLVADSRASADFYASVRKSPKRVVFESFSDFGSGTTVKRSEKRKYGTEEARELVCGVKATSLGTKYQTKRASCRVPGWRRHYS